MAKQTFYGEGMNEPIFERIIPDDVEFSLSPREVVILLLALDVAIEKAEKYCVPMLKSVRDYIHKTAMEQQIKETDND